MLKSPTLERDGLWSEFRVNGSTGPSIKGSGDGRFVSCGSLPWESQCEGFAGLGGPEHEWPSLHTAALESLFLFLREALVRMLAKTARSSAQACLPFGDKLLLGHRISLFFKVCRMLFG